MQDRFKFRVWCKTNQEWERDEICITNRNQYLIRNFAPKFTRTTDDEPQYHEINFCTGLKDKNGKLIYEGDIIKLPNDYGTYGMFAGEKREVYFYEGGFRLKPKWDKSSRGNWLEDTNDFEVIGNIYENSELLKDDE